MSEAHCCWSVGLIMICCAIDGVDEICWSVYGQANATFAPPAIAKPDANTAPATNLRMNMVPPLLFN